MRKSEITRITNKVGDQEKSEITRLTRSSLRPTKGSSIPIQKEGTGPKSCRRRRNTATIQRSGRPSRSDGGRLKVVYLVVVKVVYMEVEMVDKEARGGGSLLLASLLEAAGSKEEEEEVK